MENVSTRKPHAGNAGYVCERKARLGGHVVVYDAPIAGIATDGYRWAVMHEPSSGHVVVKTERQARELMKALAEARTLDEARLHADGIFPVDEDQAPAPATPENPADLERFLADPENEPSAEGKAALRRAFRLDKP
jgi:glycine/D-amino acid oxidase-like deaminating enzyme